LLSILALVAMFVIATILPVNMGIVAFVGAFLIGTLVAGQTAEDIAAGLPAQLFLALVGITYLFAIAQNNGTIDWIVSLAVRAVRGRVAAIPWIMFLLAATLTAVGAVSPGAVAIIAPIALGFAAQYKISPLMMGLMVIHGAQAGGFSPISIYGGITNGVVEAAGLPLNEMVTFAASFVVNFVVAIGLFVFLGGRRLLSQRADVPGVGTDADTSAADGGTRVTDGGGRRPTKAAVTPPHVSVTTPQGGAGAYGDAEGQAMTEWRHEADNDPDNLLSDEPQPEPIDMEHSRPYQILTLLGLAALAVLTLVFDTDIGFTALTIGFVLSLIRPHMQKRAVGQITWPEILLIVGVSTYVGVLQGMGTIDYVGESVAGLASPLVAALLLCLIGAIVSAFASSTAVLGSIIPLAVPFLLGGTGVGAVGFVAALAVSSTIVDVSPFSTNGALVLANAQGVDKDVFFRQLLWYAAAVTVIAPVVLWFLFVVVL
jgi:di/tricarboxylate transporter